MLKMPQQWGCRIRLATGPPIWIRLWRRHSDWFQAKTKCTRRRQGQWPPSGWVRSVRTRAATWLAVMAISKVGGTTGALIRARVVLVTNPRNAYEGQPTKSIEGSYVSVAKHTDQKDPWTSTGKTRATTRRANQAKTQIQVMGYSETRKPIIETQIYRRHSREQIRVSMLCFNSLA